MPPSAEHSLSLEAILALWCRRQGLTSTAKVGDDPVEVVRRTGWLRTLGGIDVYLALGARQPGLKRADLETQVASGALKVVPAVRGCIYLVPADEVPTVLHLAASLARPRTDRDLAKVGVEWAEVEELMGQVLEVLAGTPAETRKIRSLLPEGTVRSLGDIGKKVGLSSPLPVALRELEFRGQIERRPVENRLDTESYVWHATGERFAEDDGGGGSAHKIVERFLTFFGPATVKEIATWVGLSQRDAKGALADLDVVTVEVEGLPKPALLLAKDRGDLEAVDSASEAFHFLPFEDNLLSVHGGPGLFTDPAHHDFPVERWGGAGARPLGEVKHLGRRPLLLGHRLVGFWEMEPESFEVVVGTFEALPSGFGEALERGREKLGRFLQEELGHGRAFSLDTEKRMAKRLEGIRGMGFVVG